MSLFKKDYQEHFDFFAKCSDYIFTKHRMAQTAVLDAMQVDEYSLEEYKKI